MDRISVVVPTHNRSDLLERCIDAIYAQEGIAPGYEVIVADDASTDATPELMERLKRKYPELGYIRQEVNVGRSANRNSAIRASTGDLVVFVDDDIEIHPRYIAEVVACMKRSVPDRVAVIGSLGYAEELVNGSNFGRYVQSRYIGFRSPAELRAIDFSDLLPKYFDSGVASVRREDLFEVGLFDETFRLYGGEDEYLGYVLWKAGVRLVFAPEARATHLRTPSLASYAHRYREYGMSSLPVMLEKCPDYIRDQLPSLLLPLADRIASEYSANGARREYPLRIRVGAMALHAALNPVFVYMLEKWVAATDRVAPLYFSGSIRLLQLAWLMQGLRRRLR